MKGLPSSSPAPAPPAAPAPAPAAPSPSPGGRASTDNRSIAGYVGSPSAPSGLMASVAEDNFDSDDEFRWTGDESGLDYSPSVGSASRKSNARVAPYPSCHHVSVISTSSSTASVGFILPSAAVSCCSLSMTRSDSPPSISTALQSILSRLYDSLISPNSSC